MYKAFFQKKERKKDKQGRDAYLYVATMMELASPYQGWRVIILSGSKKT